MLGKFLLMFVGMAVLSGCQNPVEKIKTEDQESNTDTDTDTDTDPTTGNKIVSNLILSQLVKAPVKGERPDEGNINTAQYSGTKAWKTASDAAFSSVFLGETTYKVEINLTVKTGYTFRGVAANSFKHDDALTVTNAANSGKVTITFQATDANPRVPFNTDLPAAVFPAAASSIDLINLFPGDANHGVNAAVCSLMAIVNTEQPRIIIAEEDGEADKAKFTALGIPYTVMSNAENCRALFTKYKDYISRVVIWDTRTMDTLNLACTYAGIKGAIVLTPAIHNQFTSWGIQTEVIADYTNQFTGTEAQKKMAVYNYMYDNYFKDCTKRLIFSQNPTLSMKLRDYQMAVKGAMIWLQFDTNAPDEVNLVKKFFQGMNAGNAAAMGWAMPKIGESGGNEGGFVGLASEYGMYVWPADHAANLSFYGAQLNTPMLKQSVKSVDEYLDNGSVKNFVYVAIAMSDGDNYQYLVGHIFNLFSNPIRDDANFPPITWTMSPSSIEVIPIFWNYYVSKLSSKYTKDGIMTGPSGAGYFYHQKMWDGGTNGRAYLSRIIEQTNRYCKKSGINTMSVWNEGVGDNKIATDLMKHISRGLGDVSAVIYQRNESNIYSKEGSVLFRGWTDRYNQNPESNFNKEIKSAFDANAKRYVLLQAVPEGDVLNRMKNVYTTAMALTNGSRKGSDQIKFVTMDQLIQLQRIDEGLPRLNSSTQ